MKKKLIEVELYEKGDIVLTPDGKAEVIENEIFNINPFKRFVKIKFFESGKWKEYSRKIVKNRTYKYNISDIWGLERNLKNNENS